MAISGVMAKVAPKDEASLAALSILSQLAWISPTLGFIWINAQSKAYIFFPP
jgi:hypothetical protein